MNDLLAETHARPPYRAAALEIALSGKRDSFLTDAIEAALTAAVSEAVQAERERVLRLAVDELTRRADGWSKCAESAKNLGHQHDEARFCAHAGQARQDARAVASLDQDFNRAFLRELFGDDAEDPSRSQPPTPDVERVAEGMKRWPAELADMDD